MADYSIAAVTRRAVYTGSAGTGPYAFTFALLATSDLAVYKNATKLTETSDYTVTLSASTGQGSVTLGSAASSSDTITLVGARALARTTDFVTSGSLTAAALNTDLDSLVIFAQQLSEENSRTIKIPVTEGISGSTDMTIPAKADRLGKILQFNSSTGNPEVTTFTLSGVTATDTELNILDGATLSTAELNILDGVTSTTAELNILDGVTSNATELNLLDGITGIADEDDMSSNSATKLATQQSIKAYVDSQIATEDTLAELNDTNISSLASGHILIYDGSDSFDNKAVSGDITISNTGAVTIANNAVETAMINADAVTNAKIADDSIDSEHYVDGSIDTAHIADSQVTTAKIGADAVTGAKIADDAINSEHYTDGSIDTAHIADLQVTTAKIAADAITGAKIADDAIDSEHYTDGSIDTAHIADLQVTTAKIAADAITSAKIADDAISEEHLDPTVISGLADTTIASGDHLMFFDATDSALKKVDAAELGVGSALTEVVGDTSPQLGGTLDVNGNLIDMNGLADGLVLDADGDTTISSPTDDQIDFELAGADDFRMTANNFNILSGSTLTIDSGATITNSGTATGFGINRQNALPIMINGDMQVAQRSTSVTGVTTSTMATCDRVNFFISSAGTWTIKQTADAPTGSGFAKCYELDCTTADGSLSASDQARIELKFEGQDCQVFKKGTSSAEKMTVCFWVKSHKTGTHVLQVYDADNTRSVSQQYTISSADTWEKKTVNIPADTTGAFTNDNAESLNLSWWICAGTDFTSGTINTTWESRTLTKIADGQVNGADSTDNNFRITGIQIEVGEFTSSTIPAFQHESFGDSLLRCQRYYQTYSQPPLIGSANANNTIARASFGLITSMRTGATATHNGTFSWFYSNSHQPTSTAFSATYTDENTFEGDVTVSGTGMTATHPCSIFQSGSASLDLDAEL